MIARWLRSVIVGIFVAVMLRFIDAPEYFATGIGVLAYMIYYRTDD